MNYVSMKSESLIEIGRKLNIPELKNVSEETDIGKIPLTESLLDSLFQVSKCQNEEHRECALAVLQALVRTNKSLFSTEYVVFLLKEINILLSTDHEDDSYCYQSDEDAVAYDEDDVCTDNGADEIESLNCLDILLSLSAGIKSPLHEDIVSVLVGMLNDEADEGGAEYANTALETMENLQRNGALRLTNAQTLEILSYLLSPSSDELSIFILNQILTTPRQVVFAVLEQGDAGNMGEKLKAALDRRQQSGSHTREVAPLVCRAIIQISNVILGDDISQLKQREGARKLFPTALWDPPSVVEWLVSGWRASSTCFGSTESSGCFLEFVTKHAACLSVDSVEVLLTGVCRALVNSSTKDLFKACLMAISSAGGDAQRLKGIKECISRVLENPELSGEDIQSHLVQWMFEIWLPCSSATAHVARDAISALQTFCDSQISGGVADTEFPLLGLSSCALIYNAREGGDDPTDVSLAVTDSLFHATSGERVVVRKAAVKVLSQMCETLWGLTSVNDSPLCERYVEGFSRMMTKCPELSSESFDLARHIAQKSPILYRESVVAAMLSSLQALDTEPGRILRISEILVELASIRTDSLPSACKDTIVSMLNPTTVAQARVAYDLAPVLYRQCEDSRGTILSVMCLVLVSGGWPVVVTDATSRCTRDLATPLKFICHELKKLIRIDPRIMSEEVFMSLLRVIDSDSQDLDSESRKVLALEVLAPCSEYVMSTDVMGIFMSFALVVSYSSGNWSRMYGLLLCHICSKFPEISNIDSLSSSGKLRFKALRALWRSSKVLKSMFMRAPSWALEDDPREGGLLGATIQPLLFSLITTKEDLLAVGRIDRHHRSHSTAALDMRPKDLHQDQNEFIVSQTFAYLQDRDATERLLRPKCMVLLSLGADAGAPGKFCIETVLRHLFDSERKVLVPVAKDSSYVKPGLHVDPQVGYMLGVMTVKVMQHNMTYPGFLDPQFLYLVQKYAKYNIPCSSEALSDLRGYFDHRYAADFSELLALYMKSGYRDVDDYARYLDETLVFPDPTSLTYTTPFQLSNLMGSPFDDDVLSAYIRAKRECPSAPRDNELENRITAARATFESHGSRCEEYKSACFSAFRAFFDEYCRGLGEGFLVDCLRYMLRRDAEEEEDEDKEWSGRSELFVNIVNFKMPSREDVFSTLRFHHPDWLVDIHGRPNDETTVEGSLVPSLLPGHVISIKNVVRSFLFALTDEQLLHLLALWTGSCTAASLSDESSKRYVKVFSAGVNTCAKVVTGSFMQPQHERGKESLDGQSSLSSRVTGGSLYIDGEAYQCIFSRAFDEQARVLGVSASEAAKKKPRMRFYGGRDHPLKRKKAGSDNQEVDYTATYSSCFNTLMLPVSVDESCATAAKLLYSLIYPLSYPLGIFEDGV